MSKQVATVGLDDTMRLVNEIFESAPFHHLLVVEDEELVGILSDRDLFKAISPTLGTMAETRRDRQTLDKKVHQVMTRDPLTVSQNSNIQAALDLFMAHDISCIPVVNNQHVPVGVISWRDILKRIKL